MELIESGEPGALTDVIFAELLQGVSSEEEAGLVERHLRAFPVLRTGAPLLHSDADFDHRASCPPLRIFS